MPDVPGATDPTYLLDLIAAAAGWTSRPLADYHPAFALSADAWAGSTRMSVDVLAGPTNPVLLSPPSQAPWTKTAIRPLCHFVNLHGGDTTPDWFGQARPTGGVAAPVDTIALRPEDVDQRIRTGTIVAAECCYGAMHHDPATLGGRLPMMWAYLRGGGYACVGSSTTSYGPTDGNGQADLLCRFALEAMLAGASAGRALLEARQRFVRETGSLGPSDLKTLAQFDLLGDPSVVPVTTPGRPKTVTIAAAESKAVRVEPQPLRMERRRLSRVAGQALAESVSRAAPEPRPEPGVSAADLVRGAGISAARVTGPVRSFDEDAGGAVVGLSYHAVPVRAADRAGFVVARQSGSELSASTIWAK